MKQMFKGVAALAGSCLLAAGANAALITDWGFSVTSEFVTSGPDAPTWDGDTGGTKVVSSDELSWGATGGNFLNTLSDPDDNRSALVIGGGDVVAPVTTNEGTLETNGLTEETATVTHYNNPIASAFEALRGATIFTTLTLTPTLPAGPALPTIERSISFQFIETNNRNGNVGSCPFPSTSACDDIFVLNAGDLSNTFTIDGFQYTAFLTAVGLGPLPDNTCNEAGAGDGCFGLTTQEGQANEVQFSIGIIGREVPVPAPATLALLGLGLAGVGFARRRRAA